jgi:hypothetical protein
MKRLLTTCLLISLIIQAGFVQAGEKKAGKEQIPATAEKSAEDVSAGTANKADREAKLAKVLLCIGDEKNWVFPEYRQVVTSFNDGIVPFLCELLKNDAYRNRWPSIAMMIAFLSDKNDTKVLNALLDYFNTPESDDASRYLPRKLQLLHYLGLFQQKEATVFLRQTFLNDEESKFVTDWAQKAKSAPYNDPKYLRYVIMGNAAQGLIFTRNLECDKLLEQHYEKIVHSICLSNAYRTAPANMISSDTKYDLLLGTFLGSAFAERDYILEHGLEKFLLLGVHQQFKEMDKYVDKYVMMRSDDGKSLLDKCPICGITSTP